MRYGLAERYVVARADVPDSPALSLSSSLIQLWDLKLVFVGLGLVYLLAWTISIGYLRFETEKPRKVLPGMQTGPDVLWAYPFGWQPQ